MACKLQEEEEGSSAVNTANINMLLESLNLIEDLPKVPALRKDLKKWKQGQIETVVTNDLLALLQKGFAGEDLSAMQFCLGRCKSWPTQAQTLLPSYLKSMVEVTIAQVGGCETHFFGQWQ